MKNISFKRLRQLWLQIAVTSKKQILFGCLGMLGAMLLINLPTYFYPFSDEVGYGAGRMNWLIVTYSIMFYAYLSICLSSTFGNMKTKEGRIAFLTLPAGQLEKFIAYASWTIVVPIVIFMATSTLMDLMRSPLTFLFTGRFSPIFLILPQMFDNSAEMIIHFDGYVLSGILLIIIFHVFNLSLFLLGSCLWYKRVFLKTIAAAGICTFLLMILFVSSFNVLNEWDLLKNIKIDLQDLDPDLIMTVLITVGIIATAAVWWISYRLFCRREVVSRKSNLLGFLNHNR